MRVTLAFLAAALVGWCGPVPAGPPPASLPALGDDEAWARLPHRDPPLPAWARALAGPLPRTTAAMLELDHLHRADNPLGPVLAGKVRWAAADALGWDYGRSYAEADRRRAGVGDSELKALAGDRAALPAAERVAVAFARKLTRAASALTDAEAAELLGQLGPERTVALVHTVAYANFHGRVCLALGVGVEPGGPLPPPDLRPDPERLARVVAPPRPPWDRVRDADTLARAAAAPPGWKPQAFAELRVALEEQKARAPRIPLPPTDRLAALPPGPREEAARVVWSRVSYGYQPRLTTAWFACLRAFSQEAKLDRVYANSAFWVVTRTSECFY
jgi:hypothetical protein